MGAVISMCVFVVAAAALGDAAWRAAAALGAGGWLRVVTAAPLAAGVAELSVLGLGLIGASGSQPALLAVALVVWLAVRTGLPAPWTVRSGRARMTPAERLALGAALGLGAVWVAWIQKHPGLGTDPLTYHLPEAIAWAQQGDGGSVRQVVYEFPVGNYPLADETLVSWILATSRSFAPALLWVPAMAALTAISGMTGLRRAGVALLPAALGVAAILTIPIWTALYIGPHTDVGALAWLTTTATLAVASRGNPRLLLAALVAGGLALGSKTTTVTMLLVLLAFVVRGPLPRPRAALAAALVAGGVIGGLWYVRNLVQHGSPLWPFLETPWSTAIPPILRDIDVGFIQTLSSSLADGRTELYFKVLGAAPVLLLGALAAAATTRRRPVLIAAGAALVGALIWSRTPYTGRPEDDVRDLSLTTVRYLVPALSAAVVALALTRKRWATGVLAAVVAVNAYKALDLGFPDIPSATLLAGGAAAGALAASVARPVRVPAALPLAAGLVAVVGLTVAGDGFARRQATNPLLPSSPMIAWFADQPAWQDGDDPVHSAPQVYAPLAGDRLQHDIGLIDRRATCAEVRALDGWVVIGTPPFSTYRADFTADDCLADRAPVYEDGNFRVYDLRQTAMTSSTPSSPSDTRVKSSSVIAAARGSTSPRARVSRKS